MAAALPLKRPVKVGELVRRRLRELKRSPRELAEAVQVSEIYLSDLVAGRRRPNWPTTALASPSSKSRPALPRFLRSEGMYLVDARQGQVMLDGRLVPIRP